MVSSLITANNKKKKVIVCGNESIKVKGVDIESIELMFLDDTNVSDTKSPPKYICPISSKDLVNYVTIVQGAKSDQQCITQRKVSWLYEQESDDITSASHVSKVVKDLDQDYTAEMVVTQESIYEPVKYCFYANDPVSYTFSIKYFL